MQNFILLPTLPYQYIDRNQISMVVKPVCLVAIEFHCERDERRQFPSHCNVNGRK